MGIPIVCHGCGATGEVMRVTANLQCRCGSTDLDLNDEPKTASRDDLSYDYDDERERHKGNFGDDLDEDEDSFARHQKEWERHQKKTSASPGTGWTHTQPDSRANWNEYAGPTPGANPFAQENNDGDVQDDTCPVCHGTGSDPRASGGGYEENVCRNCHGTGKTVRSTGEPQNQSLDANKVGPVPLGGGWQGKKAVKITIDGQTYTATADVEPSKKMKMVAKIMETNPGLTQKEANALATETLKRYSEEQA